MVWLAACATTQDEGRFIRVTSAHFELLSSAPTEDSVTTAQSLERFRAAALGILPTEPPEPGPPMRVLLFADTAAFEPHRHPDFKSGFALATDGEPVAALVPGGTPRAVLRTYARALVRRAPGGPPPLWYEVGMAEYLSTLTWSNDRLLAGGVPWGRAGWVMTAPLLPLEELLRTKSLEDQSLRERDRLTAEAWALVHYLLEGHAVGFEDRRTALVAYLELCASGVAPDAAVVQAFEVTPPELEDELRAYLRRGRMPYSRHALDAFPAELETRVDVASPDEVREALESLELLVAADRSARATSPASPAR